MLKLTLILIISTAIATVAKAQSVTYRQVKADIGIGYTGAAGGTFALEPHYRVSDKLALGLRYQSAPLILDAVAVDPPPAFLTSTRRETNYSSFGLSVDYYFNSQHKRRGPLIFGGGGVCLFAQNQQVTQSEILLTISSTSTTSNNLGFFPRIGMEVGHFRTSAEYNFTGGQKNYYSINTGFFFGGGKKNN